MRHYSFKGGCGFYLLAISLALTATMAIHLPSLSQNHLRQYSGSYNIFVTGLGSNEAYALKTDGNAVWVYGWKDKSGRIQTETKNGTWTASNGLITISINGNTGVITERYRLVNGKFVSTEDKKRYLRKKIN